MVTSGSCLDALVPTGLTAAPPKRPSSSNVYLAYFFALALVPQSVFSDERLAFGLVWLPNILMIVTSLAFMSARDQRRVLSGKR